MKWNMDKMFSKTAKQTLVHHMDGIAFWKHLNVENIGNYREFQSILIN